MFEIKPKWSVLAMFETLKVTFQVLKNVPKRYLENELMCTVNAVIKDAPSNYASREDNGLIKTLCRKIRDDFNLNIGSLLENETWFTPTASVSTTANAMDIEDVKRAAFNIVWNADFADEMAKQFKQLIQGFG
jgi:hypothetical protein